MSIVVFVQVVSWEEPYELTQTRGGHLIEAGRFQPGDRVVIKTEMGTELGEVIKIEEKPDEEGVEEAHSVDSGEQETIEGANFILRKASSVDLDKYKEKNKTKKEVIKKCEELVKKRKLAMKIIDVLFSFDGGRIIFAFTAPGRIDFRDLVKELAQKFHKSIRMYQVGVRQETGLFGDIGPCGRPLCCQKFLKKLGSVTTDLIFDQQLAHRGPERLSGVCGRLKCCLAFEEEAYKELAKKLPAIGSKVKTTKGEGRVVDWHILKQSVMVEIEGTRIEVPLADIKQQFKISLK